MPCGIFSDFFKDSKSKVKILTTLMSLNDVDISHNGADADISPCLSKPCDPTAAGTQTLESTDACTHSQTHTQLSDTRTDLISTWKQILHHPRGAAVMVTALSVHFCGAGPRPACCSSAV